ncbi:MAG: DUF4956 domain-containing protein, partial [Bacteroidaceae bacterium]|nr:DUF4956 domain-containing protein [Bacteroidaceae bacterium]
MNLFAPLAGGLSQLAAAATEEEELFGDEASGLLSSLGSTPFWPEWSSVWEMVLRLLINVITIGIIVHAFYYPKAKRRDYYFTFSIIGVSIFLLIYLMGGVKLKIGFALGLFAIFGIIKYRTEQVPIREMTYMFVIIAVAAINGLATSVSYFELLGTNLIFIIALAICENTKWMKHVPSKLIKYDNVKLVAHGKEDELKADLEKRLGLKIIRIEVGNIDFLKDSAIIKIYYEPIMDEFGTIDSVMKT